MEEPWSNEKCLELISLYEKFPDLWDSKHPNYYTKRKRNESWQQIADHFDTGIANVKRKMCSLMGSFRAQKSKGKEYIGEGSNMKVVYVSKWFAFEKMTFLLDQKEPQQCITSDECDETFQTYEIKYENDSDIELMEPIGLTNHMNENINLSANSKRNNFNLNKTVESMPAVDVTITENNDDVNTKQTQNSTAKVNFNYFNNEYGIHFTQPDSPNNLHYNVSGTNKEPNSSKRKIIENCQCHHKLLRSEQNQNNCSTVQDHTSDNTTTDPNITSVSNNIHIFGQYIASKLKGYSSKTRAITEHAINNILFEADMGWYEHAAPQPKIRSSFS